MSFLMFAYRKLALKRQIGDKEYRQLVLSQQKQTMTDQIGQYQQMVSAAKNATSTLMNSSMFALQTEAYAPYKQTDGTYNVDQSKDAGIKQALGEKQYALMQANSITSSIFEASSQATMSQLKGQESMIDTEMASLDSQLKQMHEELAGVEKGETEAAKSDAPKFGLA